LAVSSASQPQLKFASLTFPKLLFTLDSELTVNSSPDQCDGNATKVGVTATFRRRSTNETIFVCEETMKRLLLSLLLIASLLFAFACERKGGPGAGGQTGPIIIGYYGDLTGRTSNFGQSTKAGVEMAADEINKAGGINGRQITILSEDDEGRPEKAATVVTKLINQDRVVALLGEVASGNTLLPRPKPRLPRSR
jgi:ABC-type branched-subunit amino acid transport system substrate-binding protein